METSSSQQKFEHPRGETHLERLDVGRGRRRQAAVRDGPCARILGLFVDEDGHVREVGDGRDVRWIRGSDLLRKEVLEHAALVAIGFGQARVL